MTQHHLPILNSLYLRQRKMMLKGIPDEITRLLEYEKKIIQLHLENQQKQSNWGITNVIKKKRVKNKMKKIKKSKKKFKREKKNYTLKSLVD
jgi:hypothetical protein